MPTPLSGITSLIRPRSVAVLGASARREASGNHLLGQLADGGYSGPIHVVHPDAASIDGHATVGAVADLPSGLDLACVSLPAAAVVDAVRGLAARECAAALVPAVGLTAADREAVRVIARDAGMVICGPNTMGVVNLTDRVHLNFWAGVLDDVPRGGVSLVAQSGGACLSVVRSTEAAGYARIVASGNEWVTTSADYLTWLADDEATRAVGVVIESISDVAAFTRAIARLREAGKPTVALHVGRTAAGAAATVAHTSALVGRGAAYRAYFDSIDVPLVRDYDEMAAVLDCLSCQPAPVADGTGVAIITVSGGVAALSGDTADEAGIHLAALSCSTQGRLLDIFPGSTPQNPFDAGGGATYSGAAFENAMVALGDDKGVDVIVAVLDGQASLSAGEVTYAGEDFEAVAEAANRCDAPIIVASTSSVSTRAAWRDVVGPSVPVVRGIGLGLVSAIALSRNRRTVQPWRGADAQPASPVAAVPVSSGTAHDILRLCGLDTPRSVIVDSVDEVAGMADRLRFPVVAKAHSPTLPHRTEAGGVELGIPTEEALVAAIRRIDRSVRLFEPSIVDLSFEIQEFVSSPLEAFIGVAQDPVFGPIVSVGTGGVHVELLRDVEIALTPIEVDQALALLERTVFAQRAAGYRHLVQPTSLEPLARAVSALATLAVANHEWLVAGDLNPVFLEEGSGRPVVVDSLFLTRQAAGSAVPCLSTSFDI